MTSTTAPETTPRILGARRATAPTPTFMGLASKASQESRPASPSPSPSVSAKVRTPAAAVSSAKPGTIASSTPRPSRSFSCASSAAASSSFASSLLSQTLPPPPASSSIQYHQHFSHHCPHQHSCHYHQQQQPENPPRHRHRQLSGEPTSSPSSIIHRDLQHHYSLRNHHRQQSHPQPLHGPTATTLAQSPLRRKSNSSLSSLLSSPKSSSHLRSPASRPVSPCPSSPAPSSPSASPRYHINNRSNSISTTLPPLPYFPPLPLSIDVGNIYSESEHLLQAPEHPTKSSTELNADTLYGAESHQALMSPTTSSPPVSLSGMVAALSIADANASIPILGSGEGNEDCCSLDSPSGYSSAINSNSNSNSKNSNTTYADNSRPMFLTPNFHSEGSSVASESSYLGSRRSSKDSCESTPGTQIDDLVDQMTVPDYANPQDQTDQIERTKVFLMIYRRFMRPRELLEKLIERFEALGESPDEDTHANETRLRICFCLYYWLKNHPNDILHRQTRQLVAAFLRDRVALFPCLNDIYLELLPLSSIQYFNTWRWPQPDHNNSTGGLNGSGHIDAGSSQGSSRSRSHSSSSVTVTFADSVSLPTTAPTSASSSTVSDSDSDSGFHDTNSIGAYPEDDLDEDREWGLADEDEIVLESPAASLPSSGDYNKKSSFYLADGLAPFAHLVSAFNGGSSGNASSSSARNSVLGFHSKATFPAHHQLPPRDRRSSTGSFATQTLSPCAMETFVAGRRGSASSISSNPGPFTSTTLGFAEGDLTPMQQLQLQLQPIGEVPFINKRSSSQAYRQHRAYSHSQLGSAAPVYQSVATLAPVPIVGTAASAPVTTVNSGSSTPVSSSKVNPAQSPSPAPGSHNHHYPEQLSGAAAVISKAALIFKEAMEEKVHPLSHQYHQQQHGGKSGHHQQQHHHYAGGLLASLSPPIDHLSSSSPLNIPFMEIKDKAIAEQLTCVEYGLFKKLKPRDMLRQVWKTKKGSAAFQACIAHFNFISSWVGTMILLPPKAKHRARMMEKFISIAKILRDMGNYNTTMAIIGAMNTSSIHRLVQTRELLQSKEIWNTFKELEQLMSSLRSFSEYRAALRTHSNGPSSQPCIPYLGVHLADLLSISEGNKDVRQDGTLHWQKFVLMTDVISMVLAFQQEPGYRIKPDPFISKVITDTHVLDDEEMYSKSVGTEPNKLNHSRSLSKFNFF